LQEKDIRPNKNHAETSDQNKSDLQLEAAEHRKGQDHRERQAVVLDEQ
jgi:hypothetical protein